MNEDQSADSSSVVLTHVLIDLPRSVLESDPEFGFEEAKRQLEGI